MSSAVPYLFRTYPQGALHTTYERTSATKHQAHSSHGRESARISHLAMFSDLLTIISRVRTQPLRHWRPSGPQCLVPGVYKRTSSSSWPQLGLSSQMGDTISCSKKVWMLSSLCMCMGFTFLLWNMWEVGRMIGAFKWSIVLWGSNFLIGYASCYVGVIRYACEAMNPNINPPSIFKIWTCGLLSRLCHRLDFYSHLFNSFWRICFRRLPSWSQWRIIFGRSPR